MTRDLGEVVQTGYDQAVDQYESLEQADAQWPRSRWLTDLERRLAPSSSVLTSAARQVYPWTPV